MKKQIPNLITCVRILGTLFLLLCIPFTYSFYFLYLLCGLSDILDGYIARKYQLTSVLGARLDSFADLFFVGIVLFKLYPAVTLSFPEIVFFLCILAVRIVSIIVGELRYHTIVMLHTLFNKLTGLLLFLIPLCLEVINFTFLFWLVATIALLASLEELIINSTSKQLNLDRKGLFLYNTR